MSATVITRTYAPPPVSRREILRYMGCPEPTPEINALVDRAIAIAEGKLSYRVCFGEYPYSQNGSTCDFGFARVESCDLSKCLASCDRVIVFAATVGLELDRLILRYGKTEPSVALTLQAIGAERIEALCDAFCEDMKGKYAAEGIALRPRFSAGYGDLPLAFQKELFRVLACERCIGLTLNESLMMSPVKSVTAIVGVNRLENT